MKKIVLLLTLMSSIFALNAQEADPSKTDTNQMAKIVFDKTVHDFGTLTQGGEVFCSFTFRNTGKAALKISYVKSHCGCTYPTWPKEPILPGKTGKIKIIYRKGLWGPIIQSLTVNSNARNSPVILELKGEVKKR